MVDSALQAAEVGLLYALDEDWKAFSTKAGGTAQVREAGQRRIQIIQVGPHRVRAVRMGAGSVETAVSTTALLAAGRCDWVITLGPCGGLAPGLTPGTVVVAVKLAAWQATPGNPVQPLPFPGVLHPLLAEVPGPPMAYSFTVPGGPAVAPAWRAVTVASGERFVKEPEDRAAAAASGEVVEMNLMGAAGALNNYHVPGLHLRVVSDLADGRAGEDFAAFVKNYDGRLGTWACQLIAHAKPDPTAPATYPTLRELLKPRVPPLQDKP